MPGRVTEVIPKEFVGETYYTGEDAKLEFWHYVSGTLTDPDTSYKLCVTDPSGQVVVAATTDLVKDSTGKYYYEYAISSSALLGTYKAQAIMVHGTTTNMEGYGTFQVEAAVG